MRSCALSLVLAFAACGGSQKPTPPPAKPAAKPADPKPADPGPNAQVNGVYINDGCTEMKGSAETIALFQKSCGLHDGEGCSKLAGYHLCGVGVTRDLSKAATYAEQGCDYGYKESCNNVAMLIAYPDPPISPPIAFQYAVKGCSAPKPDPQSCNTLGLMYLQGIGTPVDPVKSAAIFEDQCKQQNAGACANLAMQAYLGMGIPRDLARAAKLAESACNAGMPSACNTLGGILIDQGGDANIGRAELLFTNICNQPNGSGACDNLGQLYAHGAGAIKVDKDKASAAYKKACDAGFAKACTHLADLMSGN